MNDSIHPDTPPAVHAPSHAWEDSFATRPWTQLPEAPIVVIPIGSCEQHGPHLPLDTDTRIATRLAHVLAEQRPDVLLGPSIPFGASWEHHGFPGLLSLNHSVLISVMVELAHSADWAAGLVFVNGHGGNARGVDEAVRHIRSEGRQALAWSPRLPEGDPHAGLSETSIMLALEPELVHMDAATSGWTGSLDAVFDEGVRSVSPNGVLGDPTFATAAHGDELLARFARDLLSTYDKWRA